jgi:hypothetical protein
MNKPSSLFLFLFLVLFSLSACQPPESQLPAERPADFSLSYSSSGGMLPIGENLTLTAGTSTYEYYDHGNTTLVEFELTEQELNDLYQWLRQNRFDLIETRSEQVFDRGGESISINWGTTHYNVSNSGLSFIEEDWQEEWGNVLGAVTDLMQRKLEEQRVVYTIVLDRSLTGETVSIYLNNGPVFSGVVENADDLDAITFPQQQLPGVARLVVQVDSQAIYQEYEVTIEEAAGIQISLEDNQLIFTPFIE